MTYLEKYKAENPDGKIGVDGLPIPCPVIYYVTKGTDADAVCAGVQSCAECWNREVTEGGSK